MSAEDFQLMDDEEMDNSIIKRDFIKIYHQSGASVDDGNPINHFFWRKSHLFTSW